MATATVVELRVLGPIELVVDGASLPLTAEKHRLLLAALAIRAGELVPADVLLEALWAEDRPASARKLLHIYVSQLRALLPATIRIETHGSGYVLELGVTSVDAQRFETWCAEGRRALDARNPALARSLFAKALGLWRGPAYGELAFAEVARTQADRLDELRVVALGSLLEAGLALGGAEDLVGQARVLVAQHPHDERLAGLAMLTLYRAGRQAEALEEYSGVRSRLLDGLGLEPGPELRELQRAILVHDPSLQPEGEAAPEPVRLPAAPGVLVGRERELAELGPLLARDDVRFVVLTGAGGSGKTRLALEAARASLSSFANGAALVPLASVRDSSLVVPAFLAALGVREGADETPVDALVSALRARELLLLVDNVEHLRDACSVLVDLLAAAPRLKILATSRTVLHLSGEHVYPVEPLAPAAAAELFRRRVCEAEPRLRLEQHEDVVAAICARLEGLPLAIELAAGRARTLGPAELLERLDERLPLLTGGPRDLPARQQTLRATVEWSLELLDDEERAALERLSVFSGGCTAKAARSVCGAPLDLLAALVDHSLLQRLVTEDDSRFSMLETVRELAWEHLGDERAALDRRHAEWAVELAEGARLRGPGQAESVTRLRAEQDNLRAALAWSGVSEPQLQLRLAAALWRFWWIRGELAEGRRWLGAALEHEVGDRSARAHALVGIAGLSWSQGDISAAHDHAVEAASAAKLAGEPFLEASAHTVIGLVAKHERRFDDARGHLRTSLAVATTAGLEPDRYIAKLNLATVELDAGELASAEPILEEVLAWHEGNGPNVEGMGFALLNLGLVSHGLGDQPRARERFAAALEAFGQVEFREHVADALHGLAAVEAAVGRYEEAARLFGRAEPLLREVGSAGFEPALVARTRTTLEAALGPDRFGSLLAASRDS
ncbi:MAG: tetratricopeptide repeat protein [Actinobacteria bacterium]|nr:tetratricopeptide repeat protein [Actinomycetota bacterium]